VIEATSLSTFRLVNLWKVHAELSSLTGRDFYFVVQRTSVSEYLGHVLTSLRLWSNMFRMIYINCINNPWKVNSGHFVSKQGSNSLIFMLVKSGFDVSNNFCELRRCACARTQNACVPMVRQYSSIKDAYEIRKKLLFSFKVISYDWNTLFISV